MFSSRFEMSVSVGFQPTQLRTTAYVINRMKAINDRPGLLTDQEIIWIRAMEDVQWDIIHATVSESVQQGDRFSKICDLNESLAAEVKALEAMEPVQDGPSRE